jgi:selenocysteine lyase/cysteine desulfurase
MVSDFVGPDLGSNAVTFTKNASEALDKLANRFPFKDEPMILSSVMKYRSNDLPRRRKDRVIYAELCEIVIPKSRRKNNA